MFPPQRDIYIKVLPQHHRTTTQKKFDVRKYDNMSQHQKNFKAIQYIVQYWLKSAVKSDIIIILHSILKNKQIWHDFMQKWMNLHRSWPTMKLDHYLEHFRPFYLRFFLLMFSLLYLGFSSVLKSSWGMRKKLAFLSISILSYLV